MLKTFIENGILPARNLCTFFYTFCITTRLFQISNTIKKTPIMLISIIIPLLWRRRWRHNSPNAHYRHSFYVFTVYIWSNLVRVQLPILSKINIYFTPNAISKSFPHNLSFSMISFITLHIKNIDLLVKFIKTCM